MSENNEISVADIAEAVAKVQAMPTKRRGRPPASESTSEVKVEVPKRRGRPPGSGAVKKPVESSQAVELSPVELTQKISDSYEAAVVSFLKRRGITEEQIFAPEYLATRGATDAKLQRYNPEFRKFFHESGTIRNLIDNLDGTGGESGKAWRQNKVLVRTMKFLGLGTSAIAFLQPPLRLIAEVKAAKRMLEENQEAERNAQTNGQPTDYPKG